ncbi:uncharacterized protein [Haliotis cracherodii]|uniref:uncharacterized protein n=1 Tax=Haliotis cracherodii TaxID=6455 RepID=UPI0039EBDC3F
MKHLSTRPPGVLVFMLLLETANCVGMYVRIMDDSMEYQNQSSILCTFGAGSPIECGVECDRVPTCVSFNVKTEPDNSYVCVLLDSIPMSPNQDLVLAKHTDYYEKTCQPGVRVMGTKDLNMTTPAVYVVADMGTSGYMLQFETNFDQKSFSFINTVHALSRGQYQIISGAEDLFSAEYQKTVVVVSEGRFFCERNHLNATNLPCFTSDYVPLKDIFNTQDVNAVMADASGYALFGFTENQVITVKAPANGPWTVDSVLDLPGPSGGQFQHFPRGIRGAANLPNQNKTILFTQFYYMILDDTNAVLKRSQVCL